jgi:hypothetical protein
MSDDVIQYPLADGSWIVLAKGAPYEIVTSSRPVCYGGSAENEAERLHAVATHLQRVAKRLGQP